jgi:SAM-dependent methyltransferase
MRTALIRFNPFPMPIEGVGWIESAPGWIEEMIHGDYTRRILLDKPMLEMCGDVDGKSVLDLGCGEGRFCRMLAERGAKTIGLDPTPPLIKTARERQPEGCYVKASAESVPLQSEVFDIVVSYLTLVDIPDFRAAIKESARVLKPGGLFVVANLASHASTSANGWVRNENGERLYFPIDNYMYEFGQEVAWRDIRIVNYHRPLSAYMEAYLSSGLVLKKFLEPTPSDEDIRAHPDWESDRRVPYVNAMLWQRK